MHIRFLADTNVISETYKCKPHPVIANWIHGRPQLILSYPVILEIEMGIHSRKRHDPPAGERLRNWLDRLLETSDSVLLDSSPSVAQLQAEMMEVPALRFLWRTPTSKRLRPPGQDLAIAALAIEHQLPIATVNVRDFMAIHEYFPLPGVFDPSTLLWNAAPTPRSRRRRGVSVLPLTEAALA